jgi:nickel-dependent lactate racemase
MIQRVAEQGFLSDEQLRHAIAEACAAMPADGKRVLFIVPDQTRSMPMHTLVRALHANLAERVKRMDFLIALGTHPPLSEDAINALFGLSPEDRSTTFKDVGIYNHDWQNPDALSCIGTISADEIELLSEGKLRQSVQVTINKRVHDYDLLCIAGPVFPHEVIGFSGGNKYFYPGIAGAEILHLFHWLGALITNYSINGTKNTPVRAVVDKAAAFISVEKRCMCFTVVGKQTKALFYDTPERAWSAAADLSAKTHIVYKDKPFRRVLAMAPPMYDELWVAGKCMYKLEPVVEDGGELIIFGKHIREVSITHGELIRRVGYHVRDYFLAQMKQFDGIPGGILAHSTHVRGMGTYENGVEKPRVQVTLATGIPESECRGINLGYRDPARIDVAAWENKEDEGLLLVRNAGEILYRLRSEIPAHA